MYDVKAYAMRHRGLVSVTISGALPDSCHQAKIVDKYPGGNISYFVDPGAAQVFIEESTKPGAEVCLMMLVPWVGHAKISDEAHDKLSVFVNQELVAETEIQGEPDQFRVIALTASIGDGYRGCSIIPADAMYLAIYSSVFGPASKSDCTAWLAQNCVMIPDL